MVAQVLRFIGGLILLKYGQEACDRHEGILNACFRQLRENHALSSRQIAEDTGFSQLDVLESLRRELLSGLLPQGAPLDPRPQPLAGAREESQA